MFKQMGYTPIVFLFIHRTDPKGYKSGKSGDIRTLGDQQGETVIQTVLNNCFL
jgi:hypothetical protein